MKRHQVLRRIVARRLALRMPLAITLLLGGMTLVPRAEPALSGPGTPGQDDTSSLADWMVEEDTDYGWLGRAVATAGDVNGDGYDDVVVGAPAYQLESGRTFLYYGSAAGLDDAAGWTGEGAGWMPMFGVAVGTAGDVDGDGYDDVIVGAMGYSDKHSAQGAAFLFYGSATGLSATHDWVARGEQEDAHLGGSLGTAGDVNGDGYADAIVAAYLHNGGRVYVYHGSARGLGASPDWIVDSPQADSALGWPNSGAGTAGDVNGDGYDDVILGDPRFSGGQDLEGIAYVYHGSATGLSSDPAWVVEGNQDYAYFGESVGTAGDVDGDGYADVIVGATGYSHGEQDEGMALVYYGSPAGLSTTPGWTAEANQEKTELGTSVATAGDLNGDGYADVIVGASRYDNGQIDEGAAFVYHGSATGLSTSADCLLEGNQVSASFGYSVNSAGDVNGDSYADLIVGAMWYDAPEPNEGAAFAYHGSIAPPRPLMETIPDALSVTLPPGEALTETLTVHNAGTGPLRVDLAKALPTTTSAAFRDWQALSFPDGEVEPGLRQSILEAPDGQGTFLVYLQDQADLRQAYEIVDWTERGQYVYDTLWHTAQASQAGLLRYLDRLVQSGAASKYRSYYIVNALLVSGDISTLDALVARPEVAYVEAVKEYPLPGPVRGEPSALAAVQARIAIIRADQVWADFGIRGQGIVVANLDTGVDSTHWLLVDQYRGTSTGSHDYNWFDPTGVYPTAPGDDSGHGTFTMGVMVADDGYGVAPAARWIAAKIGSQTFLPSDALAASEWALAPYPIGSTPAEGDPDRRPHVVNNSWSTGGGNLWFQGAVAAWRAADIFPAFAAGNWREGDPEPCPIRSPADYAESFASGATNVSNDSLYWWSCRGPSSLTSEIKPDVTAPGFAWSTWPGDRIVYAWGTSVSSPHTAGCAALVLSADPSLHVGTVEDLLTSTAADLGAPGPDYDYGHGRVDCYDAVLGALVPWLSADPMSGTVAAGDSQDIDVAFDTTGLPLGTYTSTLVISSNDPDKTPTTIPVTMTVNYTLFVPIIMKDAEGQ